MKRGGESREKVGFAPPREMYENGWMYKEKGNNLF